MKTILSYIFIGLALSVFTSGCTNGNASSEETKESKKNSFLGKVTFIELGAATCTPCQMMQKVMLEMEKKFSNRINIVFYDVNTVAGKPYAYQYGIRVIPTQVFLDTNGNEYFRHEGYFPLEAVESILKLKGVE